jgi:DNA uptake protein ComE-like DNA-binding protein
LPSAEEFRVLMGFPKEGDTIGRLKVESVSVKSTLVPRRIPVQYGFSAEIVFAGASNEKEVEATFHKLFESGKPIFAEYGTPYLCNVKNVAGQRSQGAFSVNAVWVCVAQHRKAQLGSVRGNSRVAGVLREIADLYKLKEDPFRSRAFLKAAQQIESLTRAITEIYELGELEEIPGVGRGIAGTIGEYLTVGTSSLLEKLRRQLPEGALALMTVEGIGPKTAAKLNREL